MRAPTRSLSRTYYVFGVLLLLTALTIGVAFINLGPLNTIVALVIAFTKATLVALFFMQVRTGSLRTRFCVGAGVFWLGIFLVLILSDYLTRST